MKKAWKLLRDKRSAAGFLAAKRMGLSEQEYVDFLAKNPELYQISLLVEEQLKDCRQKWQGTPGQAFLCVHGGGFAKWFRRYLPKAAGR